MLQVIEMTVRATERRIPVGFHPSDLGQCSYTNDGNVVLISYLTEPLTQTSVNEYVVFVLDEDIAARCEEYQWIIYENRYGEYHEIEDDSTDDGLYSLTPESLFMLKIEVKLIDDNDQVISALSLEQNVKSLDGRVERMIDESTFSSIVGSAATSREVVNDLKEYIDSAVDQGRHNGHRIEIPKALLAAIVYHETLWRPKGWEFWRDYLTYVSFLAVSELTDKPVRRDKELALVANELNGDYLSEITTQIDNSLGVCQIQMQTLAMSLRRHTSNERYCEWIQYDNSDDDKEKERKVNNRIQNLTSLSIEDKIDLFNLLRFPKSNIYMCAKILSELNSRTNRWPELSRNQLLSNDRALKIIASEYNMGPTGSSREEAGPTSYGLKIFPLMGAPYISMFWTRHDVVDPYYSYISKTFTISDNNSLIRNKDDSWKIIKYVDGDDLPTGRVIGDSKVIPVAAEVYILEFSSNLKYIYIDGYGWTSTNNIQESLYNETIGYRPGRYISNDVKHKTIVDNNAVIRVPGAYIYEEIVPTEIIPIGSKVTIIQTSDNGVYVEAVLSTEYLSIQGWTAKSNLSSPAVNGYYDIIDNDARLRLKDRLYDSTGETLDSDSYVIVKNNSSDTATDGKYLEVKKTEKNVDSMIVEVSEPAVWTAASNIADGWANSKGDNAAWSNGKYLGQINLVRLIGRKSGSNTYQIEAVAEDYYDIYNELVRLADTDGHELQLNFGFRTYPQQLFLRAKWDIRAPGYNLAASPGRSNHQSGHAFDINVGGFGGVIYNWMKLNAPALGFIRTVSSNPVTSEAHHWENRPMDANQYGYKLPGVTG